MQVYDTAELFTGRFYSILMIMMRMYAIDYIAIHSVDDEEDDDKKWIDFATV